MESLHLFNTYTHQKERFEPLHPPFVGMYVCGPTVYGDPHLGHARAAISFDVLFRYLSHIGYKVRYVRNITDVGHLENDADEGEDKIAKKARLEEMEPMELATYYTGHYHAALDRLGCLAPSIEPRATGHVLEQIMLIEKILENGYAYIVNGSVYFDVPKYQEQFPYGKLSGREKLEELQGGNRTLDAQGDKRNPADFALWKKAAPEHIMRWPSPWSVGFPGWHIECTAMSTRYLGEYFDIHGGGLDLMFPHHEAEIAQSNASHPATAHNEARYWLHNNMITINGQKMGKSLGNFITLEALFSGEHAVLTQAYEPMAIRFFILQSHYRSTLDFSNEALQAAEKGLRRLQQAMALLPNLPASKHNTVEVEGIRNQLYSAINDDVNTAMVLAALFEAVALVHAVDQRMESLTLEAIQSLQTLMETFAYEVLGLAPAEVQHAPALEAALSLLIELRQQARKDKNYALSDTIRDKLKARGIQLNDGVAGTSWRLE